MLISLRHIARSICVSGFLAGCASPDPPAFPLHNAADPRASSSSRMLNNHLGCDGTTLAIERRLRGTTVQVDDTKPQKSSELELGAAIYICPMHPEVQSNRPGKCPKCGMKLVEKQQPAHDHH
jgi:hypothetical protein